MALFIVKCVALWEVMTFLVVVSSPLPSSHVIYLLFSLNSATKKFNFIRVSPLDGVTRGSPTSLPSVMPRIL